MGQTANHITHVKIVHVCGFWINLLGRLEDNERFYFFFLI